jgi:hypothetical protein
MQKEAEVKLVTIALFAVSAAFANPHISQSANYPRLEFRRAGFQQAMIQLGVLRWDLRASEHPMTA